MGRGETVKQVEGQNSFQTDQPTNRSKPASKSFIKLKISFYLVEIIVVGSETFFRLVGWLVCRFVCLS